MPEVKKCCNCGKTIDLENDNYVVISKETDREPATLAHEGCEESRTA
jgi:hypothetical protein